MKISDLIRYRALEHHATQCLAQAAEAQGCERDELVRDAHSARARMVEIAEGRA
jgi:hypothetical protein